MFTTRPVVGGRSMSWKGLGKLLKFQRWMGLAFRLGRELPVREGDKSGRITFRPADENRTPEWRPVPFSSPLAGTSWMARITRRVMTGFTVAGVV